MEQIYIPCLDEVFKVALIDTVTAEILIKMTE